MDKLIINSIEIDKEAANEALANLEKFQKLIVEKPIFEKLGKSVALIRDVVNTLYDKLLTDKETRDFFLGVDLSRVKEHETQYLVNLIGGKEKYQGKEIRIAHKTMDLNDRHFYIYKKHINDALRFHKIDTVLIDEILFLIEKKRNEILNTKSNYEVVGGEHGIYFPFYKKDFLKTTGERGKNKNS